jgi:hypothetical protein
LVSPPPAEFDAKHGISAVWQRGGRGQGITVAVVDTALDPSHPDLDGGVIECLDFAGDANPRPDSHGTDIARLIRMTAPECRIIGMNIFPGEQSSNLFFGYNASVRAAATKAVQHCIDRWPNIRIVNMSFAIPRGRLFRCRADKRCALCKTVNAARNVGILPVAAAGNTGPRDDTIECPGCAEGAITVAALLSAKDRAAFEGAPVEKRGRFGTSFSAAYFSGAAAMLMSRYPEGSANEIDEAIARSAPKLTDGMPGRPNYLIALAHLIGPEEESIKICMERIAAVANARHLQQPDNKPLLSAIEVLLLHIDHGLLRTGDKAKACELIDKLDRALYWDNFPKFASQIAALRLRAQSYSGAPPQGAA